ncbi:MAG: 16S rRNA (cytidine(1402)-2'-O)-methyltransferase [Pseudomonadota bacterium]
MPLETALYLVATPIGAARDITLRGLDILRDADVLAAEDTRQLRKLMDIHGIDLAGRLMLSYHDHNGPAQRPKLLAALRAGQSVAYVSDAGTPLIADPGFRLAEAALAEGLEVRAAPGASAVLSALSVSGLPTDRFLFAGFLPPKSAARRTALSDLVSLRATLIFYESPRRLAACLADMAVVLGDRRVSVSRELTKRFEETRRGELAKLADIYAAEAAPKGEVAIVVGPPVDAPPDALDLDVALSAALANNSLKDAAQVVAAATGLPRKTVYARALELSGK